MKGSIKSPGSWGAWEEQGMLLGNPAGKAITASPAKQLRAPLQLKTKGQTRGSLSPKYLFNGEEETSHGFCFSLQDVSIPSF